VDHSGVWPDGNVVCPRCGVEKPYFLKSRNLWQCRGCNKQFTVKVGTVFEDSPITLDKWMTAFWMLVNCKNGVSSLLHSGSSVFVHVLHFATNEGFVGFYFASRPTTELLLESVLAICESGAKPKTLQEAITYFADSALGHQQLARVAILRASCGRTWLCSQRYSSSQGWVTSSPPKRRSTARCSAPWKRSTLPWV
jgi:hypothetical protein